MIENQVLVVLHYLYSNSTQKVFNNSILNRLLMEITPNYTKYFVAHTQTPSERQSVHQIAY